MISVDPRTSDITIHAGTTEDVDFPVVDEAGVAVDVSTWSFFFTVKANLADVIGAAMFQKSVGNGITIHPGGIIGKVRVKLSKTDHVNLGGRFCFYDLLGIEVGPVPHVLRMARINFTRMVSTDGSAPSPSVPLVPFPGAILINGALYMQDQVVLTNFWKGVFENGSLNWYGPSTTVPF